MADDETIHDNAAVVDRPSTPAEETALGEARAKLASMTGKPAPKPRPTASARRDAEVPPGKTVSTPGAAGLAAREAPVSESAQRIRDANKNPALWDEKNPDHAKARKELREAIAADMSDEERDALANEDVSTLRSRYGITDPRRDLPHPELREKWDTESEAVGLATLTSWGVDAQTARDLHQYVVAGGVRNLGGPASAADYEAFAAKFKGRLSDGQIAALVEWHRGLGAS